MCRSSIAMNLSILPRHLRVLLFCAATTATAGAGEADTVRPRYSMDLTLDADAHRIHCVSRITVPAAADDPLDDAVFHLPAIAACGGDPAAPPPLEIVGVRFGGSPVPWTVDQAALRVRLPAPQTRPFGLEIDFRGTLPRILPTAKEPPGGEKPAPEEKGKDNYVDYGLFGYGNDILSLGSHWYPQLAVRHAGSWAGSGKPGPGDLLHTQASDFTVTFGGVPEGATVVATGTGDGRVFRADGARDFAVLISNKFVSRHAVIKLGGKPVRVSSYARIANANQLTTTVEIATAALRIFNRRFGPYPFDELKIVEAPLRGGSGGMEYSGVASVAGGQYTTLTRAMRKLPWTKDSGRDDFRKHVRAWYECVLVHEIAHQWWAIQVGNDSQLHPFVDEALTQWSMTLYFEDRYGAERGREIRKMYLADTFVSLIDVGARDAPANQPTSSYRDDGQYSAVIYCKGALFYQKLREMTGDEVFFGGLRDYYRRFGGRIAGPNDLRDVMIARAPDRQADIAALYQRWVGGAHGVEDICDAEPQ